MIPVSGTSAPCGAGGLDAIRSPLVVPRWRANKAKLRALTEIQKMSPIVLEARTGGVGRPAERIEPSLKGRGWPWKVWRKGWGCPRKAKISSLLLGLRSCLVGSGLDRLP